MALSNIVKVFENVIRFNEAKHPGSTYEIDMFQDDDEDDATVRMLVTNSHPITDEFWEDVEPKNVNASKITGAHKMNGDLHIETTDEGVVYQFKCEVVGRLASNLLSTLDSCFRSDLAHRREHIILSGEELVAWDARELWLGGVSFRPNLDMRWGYIAYDTAISGASIANVVYDDGTVATSGSIYNVRGYFFEGVNPREQANEHRVRVGNYKLVPLVMMSDVKPPYGVRLTRTTEAVSYNKRPDLKNEWGRETQEAVLGELLESGWLILKVNSPGVMGGREAKRAM